MDNQAKGLLGQRDYSVMVTVCFFPFTLDLPQCLDNFCFSLFFSSYCTVQERTVQV